MEEITLSSEFMDVAACPKCHSGLAIDYDNSELVCINDDCGLCYPIKNQIPVLLVEEARKKND
ncbi:Trm112 family protein [Propionimicrobium lymphophilum]|uniref:Uncharacterized protein n=1 Tax=Propionimicrobium lymphophilum ACS-093-V-SCH5 TaxID=883161 RepID=S2VX75_9ACTN|nr:MULTISPECIES: Trm112 family protein [Propionimicrobium]EPD32103.1 hypothetical protein HMPREF9306_01667 [Propionimicrobium lymphophilum ACS-093-V-SCH5]ETJ97080.1 hypothetical protein HMPREF1255_1193 [Propionimicrobium sp. BV2F7]MDK7710063.1 Trm112 family protein [Propionimicrobium lymphophilum]MDK7734649.1 Trm112 family protein [Propionimicrobium lymphophilum]